MPTECAVCVHSYGSVAQVFLSAMARRLSMALVRESLDIIVVLWRQRRRRLLRKFLLHACTISRTPSLLPARPKFYLESLSDQTSIQFFRFDRLTLARLSEMFELPGMVNIVHYRVKVPAIEALCLFLLRMAYPGRLIFLSVFFGRPMCVLSKTIRFMVRYLNTRYRHLLDLDIACLTPDALLALSNIMNAKGSPSTRSWGLIDGTYRRIPRPSKHQKLFYSGYKRFHAIKFLSVVLPTGIIACLDGAYPGSFHDSTMFSKRLASVLFGANFLTDSGEHYQLLADSGFGQHPALLLRKAHAPDHAARTFNLAHASCRVPVEWGFGKITTLWAYIDFHKNQKFLLQPVATYYRLAGLFTNIHTCLFGSQIAEHFGTSPPSLAAYLHLHV
eukprot:m.231693 g.231693  ORF g.231693 m.231693 type:complete len:388 (-) comp54278_c5_seq6:26-1189(-)